MEPGFVQAHRALAAICLKLGQLNQAEKAFQNAARLSPDSYECQLGLGYLYLRMGRTAKAITPLRKAVELQPKNAGVRAFLGDALRLSGRIEESIVHLEKAVALDPTLDLALHSLALAQLALDQARGGTRFFTRLTITDLRWFEGGSYEPFILFAYFSFSDALRHPAGRSIRSHRTGKIGCGNQATGQGLGHTGWFGYGTLLHESAI